MLPFGREQILKPEWQLSGKNMDSWKDGIWGAKLPLKQHYGFDDRLSATSSKATTNLGRNLSDGAENARIAPFPINDASRFGNWLAHVFQ